MPKRDGTEDKELSPSGTQEGVAPGAPPPRYGRAVGTPGGRQAPNPLETVRPTKPRVGPKGVWHPPGGTPAAVAGWSLAAVASAILSVFGIVLGG